MQADAGPSGFNAPGIVLCPILSMMLFVLLSSFLDLYHIADEMILVGGAIGLIFYLSGAYELLIAETRSNPSW